MVDMNGWWWVAIVNWKCIKILFKETGRSCCLSVVCLVYFCLMKWFCISRPEWANKKRAPARCVFARNRHLALVSKTCWFRSSIEIPQIGFFLSLKLQIRRDNNSGGRGRDPFFFLGSMPQHTLCVDTLDTLDTLDTVDTIWTQRREHICSPV